MKIRLSALALAAVMGCSSSSEPIPSITGTWDMIAYSSDGVTASSITGSVLFSAAGSATFTGTVQFPGEPVETLNESAQYTQSGTSLTLSTSTDTSEWELTFDGDEVTMQLLHDASASRLTLRRT